MAGEADRLRKENEALQKQNLILAERVHYLEAKKDELEAKKDELEKLASIPREQVTVSGPSHWTYPEGLDPNKNKLEGRLAALEGQVKRLAAAYDAWDLMRDNHASALYSLQRQVAGLHDRRRRWWQR